MRIYRPIRASRPDFGFLFERPHQNGRGGHALFGHERKGCSRNGRRSPGRSVRVLREEMKAAITLRLSQILYVAICATVLAVLYEGRFYLNFALAAGSPSGGQYAHPRCFIQNDLQAFDAGETGLSYVIGPCSLEMRGRGVGAETMGCTAQKPAFTSLLWRIEIGHKELAAVAHHPPHLAQ